MTKRPKQDDCSAGSRPLVALGAARRALVVVVVLAGVLATMTAAAAPPASAGTIVIQPGQTLWSITGGRPSAIENLVSVNHLRGNGSYVTVGERLNVSDPAPVTEVVEHRVAVGDTLIGLARQYGVDPAQIARDNHLGAAGTIYLGSVLTIRAVVSPQSSPAVAPAAQVPSPRQYAPSVVRAAAQTRAELSDRSLPSGSTIRSLVVQTARRYGVDVDLALAICDQESGFQQGVVSDADAVGAMQVLASNAGVASHLAGRQLDLLSPADNVTAGVLLLRQLTSEARLDIAIASYYQGLSSVKEVGMYADTKRYVRDVLALHQEYATGRR